MFRQKTCLNPQQPGSNEAKDSCSLLLHQSLLFAANLSLISYLM